MVSINPVNPVTLSQAIELDQNQQKEGDSDEVIAKLLVISLKLEGIYRHVSTHAAGIVICDQKLENFVLVYYSGMREALIKQKPDCIEDIIALISLYRPGPTNNITTYVARKHGLEKPDYIHPLLEEVLKKHSE